MTQVDYLTCRGLETIATGAYRHLEAILAATAEKLTAAVEVVEHQQ